MRVLLTSAGLETRKIQDYFMSMVDCPMESVKALFIPVAAIDAGAIGVLPKCMNDLIRCGIKEENIIVYDMHENMELASLRQYDIIYLCGGSTAYLLRRMNETGFNKRLMDYIHENGVVLGVSAGSLVFANNLPQNLGLINTNLDVHCTEGEPIGKVSVPLKSNIRLTNTSALAINGSLDKIEVIGD